MTILDDFRRRVESARKRLKHVRAVEVAGRTGHSERTIRRIRDDADYTPGLETLLAVERALKSLGAVKG